MAKSSEAIPRCMEAVFLVQPWVQTRTAMDCCKLCYQERTEKSHLECKRAHLSACNSLLAVLKLEKEADFEQAMRQVEEAREKCVTTSQPDQHCHEKSQQALKHVLDMYDKILSDYKSRLPNRSKPAPSI